MQGGQRRLLLCTQMNRLIFPPFSLLWNEVFSFLLSLARQAISGFTTNNFISDFCLLFVIEKGLVSK